MQIQNLLCFIRYADFTAYTACWIICIGVQSLAQLAVTSLNATAVD